MAGPPQLTPPNSDCLNSSSTLLRHVCLRPPTFLFPWGFQLSACLVVFVAVFWRVWPIHPHFLLFISVIIWSCPVLYHSSSLGIIYGHLICSTFLRHLFMNVCSLFVFVFVTHHVSGPYNRTDFTFVPKILIVFCRERGKLLSKLVVEYWKHVSLCLFCSWHLRLFPHLCWLHCLGRWSCQLLEFLFPEAVLLPAGCCSLASLLSYLFLFASRPSQLHLQRVLVWFVRLHAYAREGWCCPQMSRSSNSFVRVHSMPILLSFVAFLMTQSMAMRKIVGDSRHPWRTSVCTKNGSVSFPSRVTWHVAFSYSCWIIVNSYKLWREPVVLH